MDRLDPRVAPCPAKPCGQGVVIVHATLPSGWNDVAASTACAGRVWCAEPPRQEEAEPSIAVTAVIAPSVYALRRQREQADEERLVAD